MASLSAPCYAAKYNIIDIHFPDDPVGYTNKLDTLSKDAALITQLHGQINIADLRLALVSTYTSKSDRTITAIELGVLYYSVFNDHLRTGCNIFIKDLLPGATTEKLEGAIDFWGAWQVRTIVTYISRVRFEDGSIWERDATQISSEIKKQTQSFFKETHLARTDIPSDVPKD